MRFVALGAMLWLAVEAFSTRYPGARLELSGALSESVLSTWSLLPPADTLSLRLDSPPNPAVRDWLRALRRAGTPVGWSDGGIPSLMIEMDSRPDPAGGLIVRVSGPPQGSVRLEDDLGELDRVPLGSLGASLRLPDVAGQVKAMLGGTRATSSSSPQEVRRHLVLLGMAGWETKFVAAALEERGWEVDARLIVAPGLAAGQGKPFPLDTAQHAAIIALDSAAAAYAGAITTFVHSGGGAILGPDAARIPGLRTLTPGRGGSAVRARLKAFTSSAPREALRFRDLQPLVPDALGLESRDGHVALAVRRAGSGRVAQIGYADTWRWRMEGGPDAVAAHRAWWAELVASVAYGGEPVQLGPDDPAPLAALAGALGAPSMPSPRSGGSRRAFPLVLALLLASLFGEWTSRRLRGPT